jgi:hypothetical protein
MSHLELFHVKISQYELYKEGDELVDQLLHDMATERIVHISKYREARLFLLASVQRDSSPAGTTFQAQNSACAQICFVTFLQVTLKRRAVARV